MSANNSDEYFKIKGRQEFYLSQKSKRNAIVIGARRPGDILPQ